MLDVAATIERHGWAVPVVLDDGPGDPAFAYSIGLQERGLPELLVIGPCPTHAGTLVQHIATVLAATPSTARAGTVVDLPSEFPWDQVLLGEVQPHWARRYVIQADAHYDRAVTVLQILVPEDDASAPDDAEVDPTHLERQPVLSEPDRPWLLPLGRRLLDGLEEDGEVARTSFALLPIVAPDGPIGREELVTIAPADGDSWVLTSQPALADWCSVGATIAAGSVESRCRLTRDLERLVRYRRVIRESHWVPHRWAWHGTTAADSDRLFDQMTAPTRYPHLRVAGVNALPHAITVAVQPRHAASLRSAFRRLERDGLVTPRTLFHRGEDPDLAPRDPRCPCCAASPNR